MSSSDDDSYGHILGITLMSKSAIQSFCTFFFCWCYNMTIGVCAVAGVSSLWNDGFVLSFDIWGVRVLLVQRYGITYRWHQNWTAVCWTVLETFRPTNCLPPHPRGTYEVFCRMYTHICNIMPLTFHLHIVFKFNFLKNCTIIDP